MRRKQVPPTWSAGLRDGALSTGAPAHAADGADADADAAAAYAAAEPR